MALDPIGRVLDTSDGGVEVFIASHESVHLMNDDFFIEDEVSVGDKVYSLDGGLMTVRAECDDCSSDLMPIDEGAICPSCQETHPK